MALAELEWAIEAGATTVMLSPIPTPGGLNLGALEHDPMWTRLVAADMPAVVHASNPGSPALRIGKLLSSRVQWQMGVPFQLQLGVLHIIDGGVLERHPALEIGFFEGDVGWLDHWLGRLDETYEKMALVAEVPARSALEQFRAQCVISGEPADRGLAATAELIGADRVLWASDWPHQDGSWPDPLVILRDRDDLDDAAKFAILVDGPARFFRIDLHELVAHVGSGWSLDARVDDLAPMLSS